jgi:hypothetical protein
MNSRRPFCALLAAALAAPWARTAAAQAPAAGVRMVVELFTSQGCSSCPPADEVLAELAGRPDVIALSLPVDYWDYLGWKDTLASSAHTARQKGYSIARGDRQVYTPQAVIDGVVHVIGSKRGQIERAAAAAKGQDGALTIPVSVARSDGRWAIALPAAPAGTSAKIVLMTVTKASEVAIGRGENAQRKITYTNVVRSIVQLGEWSGPARSLPVDPGVVEGEGVDGFVVFVQAIRNGKPGAILGAAKSPTL